MIRKSAAVHANSGRMAWDAHRPHDFYPTTVMLDAEGGSTKIVLKHPGVRLADSVRSITLLAILTGTKDTYAAMQQAFCPPPRSHLPHQPGAPLCGGALGPSPAWEC